MNFSRFMMLSIVLVSSGASANQVLVCKSKDFRPSKYEGQGLKMLLNPAGELLKVSKIRGSWFCDEGTVNGPRRVQRLPKADIYEVNFGCDEYDGRVAIGANGSVLYGFSYADDERDRRVSYALDCRRASR